MSATLQQVANQTFDYIICGGGTAGLTLASRLSEDPHISVLVLESGNANLNDPAILRPASFGSHFANKDYAWEYQTIKQTGTNCQHYWQRGKGLGGSSGINFLCWTRPYAGDIDDLERLGNPGWNWKNHAKYIARSEGFIQPSEEVAKRLGVSFDGSEIGRQGPLKITYPATIPDFELTIHESYIKAGIPRAAKPFDGTTAGAYFGLNTYDPESHTRSYSVTAYYNRARERSNFTVLTAAHVNRIVSESGNDGLLTATGVQFDYEGKTYTANAKKEVVLSAGCLKNPQILELSGIGNKEVLEKIDVPLKLEVPGVGNNVQEHTFVSLTYQVRDDVDCDTLDVVRDPEIAAKHLKLHESGKGIFTTGVVNFAFAPLQTVAPTKAESIVKAARENIEKNADKYPPGLLEQYKIQLERLENGSPGYEIVCVPGYLPSRHPPEKGKRYVSILVCMNHTWSRGTIHAVSKDPCVEPEFDPHYFEEEIDKETLLEAVKFTRNFTNQQPFQSLSTKELNPGPDVKDDTELLDFIKETISTTWHGASSCSMLPKASGGVVDPELKVYGTNNLRIVDLSIVPLHFAAHPQASVYGIAEQAADIIRRSLVA